MRSPLCEMAPIKNLKNSYSSVFGLSESVSICVPQQPKTQNLQLIYKKVNPMRLFNPNSKRRIKVDI
jgi:hypothetical protein